MLVNINVLKINLTRFVCTLSIVNKNKIVVYQHVSSIIENRKIRIPFQKFGWTISFFDVAPPWVNRENSGPVKINVLTIMYIDHRARRTSRWTRAALRRGGNRARRVCVAAVWPRVAAWLVRLEMTQKS